MDNLIALAKKGKIETKKDNKRKINHLIVPEWDERKKTLDLVGEEPIEYMNHILTEGKKYIEENLHKGFIKSN